MITTRTKAEARTEKGKGKEGAYPQSCFSASETPSEDRMTGIPAPLTILVLLRNGMARDILYGWHQSL